MKYFKEVAGIIEKGDDSLVEGEDRDLFIQNVFSELDGLEYRLGCSHDGSKVLEILLSSANAFQLRVFYEKIREKIDSMIIHRYASHVIETWIKFSANLYHDDSLPIDGPVSVSSIGQSGCEKNLMPSDPASSNDLEISKNQLNHSTTESQDLEGLGTLSQQVDDLLARTVTSDNVLSLMENPYSTHIIRNLLKKYSNSAADSMVSKLNERQDTLINSCCGAQASAVMQTLLGLRYDQTVELLFPGILNTHYIDPPIREGCADTRNNTRFINLSESPAGSRLCEAVLQTSKPDVLLLLLNRLIRPNIENLIVSQTGNFVVQSAISACHNGRQFSMLIADMGGVAADLISLKRHGLLTRILDWYVKNNSVDIGHDDDVCEVIMDFLHTVFHCKMDRKMIFSCALYMCIRGSLCREDAKENSAKFQTDKQLKSKKIVKSLKVENFQSEGPLTSDLTFKNIHGSRPDKPESKNSHSGNQQDNPCNRQKTETKEAFTPNRPISPAGCALLSTIFELPAKVNAQCVIGFLDCSVALLLDIARHPSGSRTIEAFLNSKTVSEASKSRVGRKLADNVGRVLAIDKFGSHVVEACWRRCTQGDLRTRISRNLLDEADNLRSNQYGRIVLSRCRVEEFSLDPKAFEAKQVAQERKRILFEDLLNEDIDSVLAVKPLDRSLVNPDVDKLLIKGVKKKKIKT